MKRWGSEHLLLFAEKRAMRHAKESASRTNFVKASKN